MNKYIIINTTTDNMSDVIKIQKTLLDEKLAACIQVSKIKSYYNWNNKKCESEEFLIVIKTKKSLFNQIKDKIISVHSYDLPEIISYEINNISEEYAKWIDENTKEEIKWT